MKTIKVGIWFWFEPKGEHKDIFEDYTSDEEIIEACKQLTSRDLQDLVFRGETYESLQVKIEETL